MGVSRVSLLFALGVLLGGMALMWSAPARAQQVLEPEPTLTVAASDTRQFRATVTFPEALTRTRRGGASIYTELKVPGVPLGVGEPGAPAIPVYRHLIAAPSGAGVTVRATPRVSRTLQTNLFPVQPQPVDQYPPLQGPLPFTRDIEIYSRDAAYPANPVTVRSLGPARDLQVLQVEVATGQYNPVRKTLTLYGSVDLEISFEGGRGTFASRSTLSPFERAGSVLAGTLTNSSAVGANVSLTQRPPYDLGEEYLILTHSKFLPAAERLAQWKNEKGILTKVVIVNDGAGPGPDTAEQIDEFIHDRYRTAWIRPSYVLLMGDAEYVPTFYVSTGGSATTGTDHPYSTFAETPGGAESLLPYFAVGRIPVDTLAQATVVVDKIIGYEKTPVTSPLFYQWASIAAQFECCREDQEHQGTDSRTFIEVSEFARNVMMSHGHLVQRIYARTGSQWPARYYDDTPLPSDLLPASGFAWSGSTSHIINAFNMGRFLIMHRDHGGVHGWVTPWFTSDHVRNDLHNGNLLPVVFSVNCASGFFDNETANGDYGTTTDGVYFVEELLRKEGGGAVGILGDTRNSPSWPNTALTRGFFDAIWPDAIHSFGGNTSLRRLGDILNHGKLYLLTQVPVASALTSTSDVRDEFHLWHVYGDPTLEIRTSPPPQLLPSPEILVNGAFLTVRHLAEGAVVTVYQETDRGLLPLGRATAERGTATVELTEVPEKDRPVRVVVGGLDLPTLTLPERTLPNLLALKGLTVDPASVRGGSETTGKVTLSSAAPQSTTIALQSSAPELVSVPATVTLPAGATEATFTVATNRVAESETVLLSARLGAVTRTVELTVQPPLILPPLLASLSSFTLSASEVPDLGAVVGTVTLDRAAPLGGAAVRLASDRPEVVFLPETVTVPAGETTASFTVTARGGVRQDTPVVLTATRGRTSKTATLTVRTLVRPAVGSLTLKPLTDAAPGQTVTVAVVAGQGLVGIQKAVLCVTFPPAVASAQPAPQVDASSGVVPGCRVDADAEPGQLTLRLEGMSPSAAEGELLRFQLAVARDAAPGDYPLEWSLVQLSGSTGQEVRTRVVDGKLTIPGVPGDVDGDGRATVRDALLVLRIVARLQSGTPAQEAAGDLDGSGSLDILDVVLLIRKAAGL